MAETLHITLRGRVQGVGFRAFTVSLADRYGIVGWVRNAPDGSVEVIARGSDVALHQFLARLHDGPPSGRVDVLESHNIDVAEDFVRFSVRH